MIGAALKPLQETDHLRIVVALANPIYEGLTELPDLDLGVDKKAILAAIDGLKQLATEIEPVILISTDGSRSATNPSDTTQPALQ